MGIISGTIYFMYYLTIGYFCNYQKHLLLREKCKEQWNKSPSVVVVRPPYDDDKKYCETLYRR